MRFGLLGSPARLGGSKAGMLFVIALGCLLAIAGGALASDQRTSTQVPHPPPFSAKQGDAVVPATLGSYLWGGLLMDAGYPLPIHKRLTVSPGDKVSLRIGAPAARVEVSLDHVAGSDDARPVVEKLATKPVSPSRSYWVTKLPRNLATGNLLDISVRYANNQGNADFWVGLRAGESATR